jgi:hypothetical protein
VSREKWGPFELSEYLAAAKEFAQRKMYEIAASEKRVAKPSELYKMYLQALEKDLRVPKPLPEWLLSKIENAIQKVYREHRKVLAIDLMLKRVFNSYAEKALRKAKDVVVAELVEE